MAPRPWNRLPIAEAGEPLEPLPAELLRLEPHPYQALGAPYGGGGGPFQLRSGVIARLLRAQRHLQQQRPELCLAIFDGWRPLAVQAFMVRQAIADTCRARGLEPDGSGPEHQAVVAEVGRFWAPPNDDPAAPPPHSTGAAVDLTLAAVATGEPLAMGSAIDAIGAVSEPDHWLERAGGAASAEERRQWLIWHGHRSLLREVMAAADFCQHPHEWWHFSWGDQLWAWRLQRPRAVYGRLDGGGRLPSGASSSADRRLA